MPSSQRSWDQPASKHVLLFSDLVAHRKSLYPTKPRYYCNSLSCKPLPQLIDNSGVFFLFFFVDRQVSYSSLSHFSSVLAANNRRLVLTFQVKSFLQRSSSFSLASASRVQHDNESWHARQRANLQPELVLQSNSCVGWCVHAKKKKTVPQRCSRWDAAGKIARFCTTNFGTIFGKVLVRSRPVRYLRYLHTF